MYVAVILAVPGVEAVKVAEQMPVELRVHGEPVKLPVTPVWENLTVPVGFVAPEVAVDFTVAVQLEAWSTRIGVAQATVVEVDCKATAATAIRAVLPLPKWVVSPG